MTTTPCRGFTTACTGRDLLPVRFGIGRPFVLCCGGCRSTSLYRSAGTVERRLRTEPVTEDRRQWKPVWLRNLTARDETGLLR